jgi:hypothetical protein
MYDDNKDIQNDFIYKLVNYYLEEMSLRSDDNTTQSVANFVNTIMSFYLLIQQNGTKSDNDMPNQTLNKNSSECDIPLIEELLKNHEKFMSENSKQLINIKSIDSDNFIVTNKNIITDTNDLNIITGTNDLNIITNCNDLNMIPDPNIPDPNIPDPNIPTNQQINKLDEAFKRLYSRLNTPLINLIIAVIVFNMTTYLFGY